MGYRLDRSGIINDLKADEGFRAKLYYDTVGKMTGGYGHNFDDNGLSMSAAEFILNEDIDKAISECQNHFSWFDALSDNRQKALVEMCFQLGITGLLRFVNMLTYMQNGDYKLATTEALSSKWALQVPKRAARIAALIQNG